MTKSDDRNLDAYLALKEKLSREFNKVVSLDSTLLHFYDYFKDDKNTMRIIFSTLGTFDPKKEMENVQIYSVMDGQTGRICTAETNLSGLKRLNDNRYVIKIDMG